MRILEPKDKAPNIRDKSSARKSLRRLWILPVFVIVSAGTAIYIRQNPANDNKSDVAETTILNEQDTNNFSELEKSGPRKFSGNEFRLLYDNLLLANTDKIDTPPLISGDDIADARIRQIAEARGYKLRRVASSELPVNGGYPLQYIVHEQWKELQSAASNAGMSMTVVSAYRSVEDQRALFNSRLQAEAVSISDVAAGVADAKINEVLVSTAIPGYSKHHSGYTVDILCEGWEFENFKSSNCHEWLTADNYFQAKQFGFIPSYPTDADLQGPDPEAWEYVYVGMDLLNY